MNLLGKFTLALLVCGLAPLLLGILLTHTATKRALRHSGQQARDALEEKARENVTTLVRSEGEHLKTFIRGIANETQILSRTGRLGFVLETNAYYQQPLSLPPGIDEGAIRDLLRSVYTERIMTPPPGRSSPPPLASRHLEELDAFLNTLDEQSLCMQLRYCEALRGESLPPPIADHPPAPPHPGEDTARPDPVDRDDRLPYFDLFRQLDFFWPAAMAHLGYLDMLLVDGERGDVVYSVARNIDLGASLTEGPLAESIVARAYRKVWEADNNRLVFEDVSYYLPIPDMPICVVGAPVIARDKRVGVALFLLPLERFDAVLNAVPMEGDSTMYLVGPDYLPRTDVDARQVYGRATQPPLDETRLDIEPARTVFNQGASGDGIYTGPSGEEALIAYAPVDLMGVTWALIAQVDTDLAFAAVREMEASSAYYINRMLYMGDFIIIAAILVLCFVADYLAKPIVRPLRSTVAILKGMVQGEDALNQRLVVRGKDEVAELASSFNRFMDKLQVLYRNLEKEVAERKAAQEEVERRQQYYKALIEHAPDVIVLLDALQRPRYVSPAFERVFGYAREEVLGRSLVDKLHPDDMQTIERVAQEALAKPGQPTHGEYRFKHKDGRWLDVESVGTNHMDDENVAGVVLNMRDVTRRKEADRVLRQYSATLERDVAERTLELQKNRDELAHALDDLRTAQDQLVLNEKMASLGALTAGIAHEIKNPLNFVTNFAELTTELSEELLDEMKSLETSLPENKRDNLFELLRDIHQNSRKIREHGRRADTIVKSMLLHSRGKKDEWQKTDINALLEEYVHLSYHGMRAQNSTFNIQLDLKLDPNLPEVEIVPQDISRVFLNVLNNGCFAAFDRQKEEGAAFQPKLHVATERDGDDVVVRIRDNGKGIPREALDKIFTPFYTTKPAGKGTGLGLSISHDIVVREHQGALRVDSKPGEFTEFQIVLPLKRPEKESAA